MRPNPSDARSYSNQVESFGLVGRERELAANKADAKASRAFPKCGKADSVTTDPPCQYPLAAAIGNGTRSIGTKRVNAEREH